MIRTDDLKMALANLRQSIHSMNRNPIPSRARIKWRAELDRILEEFWPTEEPAEAKGTPGSLMIENQLLAAKIPAGNYIVKVETNGVYSITRMADNGNA